MANKASIFDVFKKFVTFVMALVGLFRKKKEEAVVERVRRYEGAVEDIEEGYKKIDRKKDRKKAKTKNTKSEKERFEKVKKRLDNMF